MNKNINKEHIIIGLLIVILTIIGFKQSNKDVSLNDNLISSENMASDTDSVEKSEDMVENKTDQLYMCHIDGEVNKPGVYSFYDGARLKDIVEDAGGLTDNADLESVNLSLRVKDEMKIHILSKEEALANVKADNQIIQTNNTLDDNKKVNINTADIDKLKSLPGIGDSKAKKIIDFRENNKFESIEDMKNVDGIGEKTFENLKDYISVS